MLLGIVVRNSSELEGPLAAVLRLSVHSYWRVEDCAVGRKIPDYLLPSICLAKPVGKCFREVSFLRKGPDKSMRWIDQGIVLLSIKGLLLIAQSITCNILSRDRYSQKPSFCS